MGPIKSVDGIYRQMEGGTMDTLALLVDFESGATGLLSSPRPSPVFWRVHVFGQHGNIESRGPLQSIQSMSGKEAVVKEFAPINALQFQLEAFARAIEGKTDYLITPQEILNTVEAFEASTMAVD
jgi:predicted dehydrogenase